MSQYDPLDLQGQERKRTRKAEREKSDQRRAEDDFKWLMSDKRGRRFVWGLLDATGVFRSSFTGNSETFFREGQRNIGLMVMAQIHEVAPEQYAVMLKEHKDGARNDDDGSRNDH